MLPVPPACWRPPNGANAAGACKARRRSRHVTGGTYDLIDVQVHGLAASTDYELIDRTPLKGVLLKWLHSGGNGLPKPKIALTPRAGMPLETQVLGQAEVSVHHLKVSALA